MHFCREIDFDGTLSIQRLPWKCFRFVSFQIPITPAYADKSAGEAPKTLKTFSGDPGESLILEEFRRIFCAKLISEKFGDKVVLLAFPTQEFGGHELPTDCEVAYDASSCALDPGVQAYACRTFTMALSSGVTVVTAVVATAFSNIFQNSSLH